MMKTNLTRPLAAALALSLVSLPALSQTYEIARSVSAALGAQGRLMWIDGTANLTRIIMVKGKPTTIDYSATWEGVRDIVAKCKAAHVNTLVVDVKPLSGEVLYDSKIAPRMRVWRGRPVPDFDLLAAFVQEGHRAGLQVDAAINILSEGHKLFSVGPVYSHPDWQSIVYTVDRGLVAPDGARLPVRVPNEPDDAAKPPILADDSAIQSGEPTSGLVGLESTAKETGPVGSDTPVPVGQQVNLILDDKNRVAGFVDNALLGDDPLFAPEDGHLIPITSAAGRAWVGQHARVGRTLRFDLRTARTPITQAGSEKVSAFVNALHPDARRHELDVVREICQNYAVDGLVLDRCRYSNLYNDFSDRSRAAFASWLGKPVNRWPEDVFAFASTPGNPVVEGRYYKPWLEFRATVIRQFVSEVARAARAARPGITLGTYVGAWYPRYYEVGVNWGSPKTRLRYRWFTSDYPRTGYAEFFDWISTGCYYPTATKEEARHEGRGEKGTVEYGAQLSNQAVASGAFVYAGINVPDFADRPEAFLRALEACGRQSQGWMIFDLTYVNAYNFWPYLERAYSQDATPPNLLPDLLTGIRAARDAAD